MSHREGKFGCSLGCKGVGVTESTKETGAKDDTPGGAAGVTRALEDQRDHRGLDCVDLGGCQATDCEGVANALLEYTSIVQPCSVGVAGTEGQDPA